MTQATINGVRQFYGPRTRGEAKFGSVRTSGVNKELVIEFDGANYSNVTGVLPAGAVVRGKAVVEVREAFALGGTTPTILIGVDSTDRLASVSEAQAEAVGVYAIAPAGVFAVDTPLTADKTIVVSLGGTSPTITNAGLLKLTIPYTVL